jgi:hypothetical protein
MHQDLRAASQRNRKIRLSRATQSRTLVVVPSLEIRI